MAMASAAIPSTSSSSSSSSFVPLRTRLFPSFSTNPYRPSHRPMAIRASGTFLTLLSFFFNSVAAGRKYLPIYLSILLISCLCFLLGSYGVFSAFSPPYLKCTHDLLLNFVNFKVDYVLFCLLTNEDLCICFF